MNKFDIVEGDRSSEKEVKLAKNGRCEARGGGRAKVRGWFFGCSC